MPEETKPVVAQHSIEKKNNGGNAAPAENQTITPEYVPALEKLDKPELVSLAAAFFSSKTTLGPDPETAKLMAQTEMHHETCRLEAFKKNLENQSQDGKRDHEYRLKRLNYDTILMGMVLLLALAGAGTGLYLTVSDHSALGSNILIASVALIYYIIGGKTPFSKKDE
jgi:hypothetical protein